MLHFVNSTVELVFRDLIAFAYISMHGYIKLLVACNWIIYQTFFGTFCDLRQLAYDSFLPSSNMPRVRMSLIVHTVVLVHSGFSMYGWDTCHCPIIVHVDVRFPVANHRGAEKQLVALMNE